MVPLLVPLGFCAATAGAQVAQECLLRPSSEVQLAVQTGGVVHSVNVGRGDAVLKDQVLVTQQDTLERAQLRIAQARAQDRSALDGVAARLQVAEQQLDRVQDLADGSLVTQERLDAAAQDALLLRQELAAAQARLRIARLEADQAQAAVDRLALRAPIAGVITERRVDPGEYASEQAPVLTLAVLDPLRAEAWLPADLWGSVSAGDSARIATERNAEARFSATVTSVDPVLETVSSTFRVTLDVPNASGALPAGLPCSLFLDGF